MVDAPVVFVSLAAVAGSGLIAWGVTKSKVAVLENRMNGKVTKDTFAASLKGIDDKLDIVLKGLDRVHERFDDHLSQHHGGK